MKYCISCGKEIEETAVFCPSCGTRQDSQNQSKNLYQPEQSHLDSKMSINKILSLIALGLCLVGVAFGGLFAEIASLIISIVVLKSKAETEKEAYTFAKIALVISIVLIVFYVVYIILVGGVAFDQIRKLNELQNHIDKSIDY